MGEVLASASESATVTEKTALTAETHEAINESHLALMEKELENLITKKKSIERTLATIELNIYNLETTYLDDTSTFGNIVKGFDLYLTGRQNEVRKRQRFVEADRIFSTSSVTLNKSLDIKEREEKEFLNQSDGLDSPMLRNSAQGDLDLNFIDDSTYIPLINAPISAAQPLKKKRRLD